MILSVSLSVLGFIMLIKGAALLINNSINLAKRFKISDLTIGLTVVAFGTSAPELIVNAISSFSGQSDIVFGNVIGSNNFNLFIILGIVGLIMPISVKSSIVKREIPFSFLAAVLILALSNRFFSTQEALLGRWDGLLLLLCFSGFLWYVLKNSTEDVSDDEEDENIKSNSLKYVIFFMAIGLVMLVLGGRLVVDSAIEIASGLGLSQKIIGLTIIAAGTSLPELVTSIVAASKKNSDIAIGNVLGSNIFNVLLVLPVSAVIHPIPFNTLFNVDIFVLLGGTLFLFAAMFMSGRKLLDRWEAGVLLIFYVSYVIWQISLQG